MACRNWVKFRLGIKQKDWASALSHPREHTKGLPDSSDQRILRAMLSVLASIIGIIALILMIPTIIPFLGWANWLIVPIALLGAVIGSFSSTNFGRNFCLVVAALGVLRLVIGGGII